jgi:hypothetical protein
VELEAYRQSAEGFLTDLTREEYRHFAGLKASYEIEPIYEAHADLFTRGSVERLRGLTDASSPGSEQQRRLRMLLDFAVQGHIGHAAKRAEAELANREATLTFDVDGASLGFRESSIVQANEPDAGRRVAIEQARLEVIATELNDLYAELIGCQHAVARELGYGSYRDLCATCKGVDLEALGAQASAFTTESDAGYAGAVDGPLREALGYGLDRLARADIARFMRAPDLDRHFPSDRLVECFEQTLDGLGIDLRAQPGVVLDLEPRPSKTPRAFCAPVRAPGEVYLVLSPVGGHDDFAILFHEGGHTEHYASVDPSLPFEFRMLGDNAITESFAFLFERLIETPAWREHHLGITDAGAIAAHARATRTLYLRRYCAKFAYELELHDQPTALPPLAERYAELLSHGLRVVWSGESYLADVDPGFYSSCYLRAWALEAHLRRHFVERFGELWFQSPEAGALLRSLWREGQRRSPDEVLGELTGERLDLSVLLADLALV